MKKVLIAFFSLMLIFPTLAQEGDSSPKFRFGINVAPNLSWFRPADKKELESDGAKAKIAFGFVTEFKIAKNYSFVTGIDFPNLAGGNLKFIKNEGAGEQVFYTPEGDTTFDISSRAYNLQYVNIPLTLKLKTNEIGYLTYFAQLGGHLGLRTKAVGVDKGTFRGNASVSEIPDVDIAKDVQIIKAALTIGGGVEYNLSGNTSIVASIAYMYGVTNALKKESDMLKNADGSAYEQKANLDQFVLNIGILF